MAAYQWDDLKSHLQADCLYTGVISVVFQLQLYMNMHMYTVSGKKEASTFSTESLAFLEQFLWFLHQWKQE